MPSPVNILESSLERFYHNHKTATSSAAALATTQALRRGVIVKNPSTSSESVFVGGSTVTDSTGFEIEPGEKEFFPASDVANVYVVTASGSVEVSYLGF